MNIIEALNWRYAAKNFDSTRIIPNETIEVIKESFNLTASSYGLQPVKLLLVSNKSILQELVPISSNQKQVGQASHLCIFCVYTNIDEAYIRTYFENIKFIRNTPDAVLSSFRDSIISGFGSKSTDEIYNWGAKQAYLALGNMLTVCATQEIDACPMEGFDPVAYEREKKHIRDVEMPKLERLAAEFLESDFVGTDGTWWGSNPSGESD